MSVKTSVNIPDDLFNEVRKLSGNFSSIVTEALKAFGPFRLAINSKGRKDVS